MYKNINISSGSKSFQNKIFGSIVKLTKPSFVHSGKIFSNTIFNNQKIIPLSENSQYFQNHGLIDSNILIDYSISADFNNTISQSINEYIMLSTHNLNPIAKKNIEGILTSITSSSSTIGGSSISDPYDDNPTDCPIP
jgi:hypothetical protein